MSLAFSDCTQQNLDPMVGVKHDQGKTRMELFFRGCSNAIEKVAEVMTFGANKYTDDGWQDVEAKRYWDALYRHLNAHHKGELNDDESGLTHLAHAATNIMFLIEKTTQDNNRFDMDHAMATFGET